MNLLSKLDIKADSDAATEETDKPEIMFQEKSLPILNGENHDLVQSTRNTNKQFLLIGTEAKHGDVIVEGHIPRILSEQKLLTISTGENHSVLNTTEPIVLKRDFETDDDDDDEIEAADKEAVLSQEKDLTVSNSENHCSDHSVPSSNKNDNDDRECLQNPALAETLEKCTVRGTAGTGYVKLISLSPSLSLRNPTPSVNFTDGSILRSTTSKKDSSCVTIENAHVSMSSLPRLSNKHDFVPSLSCPGSSSPNMTFSLSSSLPLPKPTPEKYSVIDTKESAHVISYLPRLSTISTPSLSYVENSIIPSFWPFSSTSILTPSLNCAKDSTTKTEKCYAVGTIRNVHDSMPRLSSTHEPAPSLNIPDSLSKSSLFYLSPGFPLRKPTPPATCAEGLTTSPEKNPAFGKIGYSQVITSYFPKYSTAPEPESLPGFVDSSSPKPITPEKYSVCEKDDRSMAVSTCPSSKLSLEFEPSTPVGNDENLAANAKPQQRHGTNNKASGGYVTVFNTSLRSLLRTLESSPSVRSNDYESSLTPPNLGASVKRPENQNILHEPAHSLSCADSSSPNPIFPLSPVLSLQEPTPPAYFAKGSLTTPEEDPAFGARGFSQVNTSCLPWLSTAHESASLVGYPESLSSKTITHEKYSVREKGGQSMTACPSSEHSLVSHATSSKNPGGYVSVFSPSLWSSFTFQSSPTIISNDNDSSLTLPNSGIFEKRPEDHNTLHKPVSSLSRPVSLSPKLILPSLLLQESTPPVNCAKGSTITPEEDPTSETLEYSQIMKSCLPRLSTAPKPAPLLGCLKSSSSKTMTPEKYSACKKDDRNMIVSPCPSSELSLVSRPASPLSIAENLVPNAKPQQKNATNNKNPGGYVSVFNPALWSSFTLQSSPTIKSNDNDSSLTLPNSSISEKRPEDHNTLHEPVPSLSRPVSLSPKLILPSLLLQEPTLPINYVKGSTMTPEKDPASETVEYSQVIKSYLPRLSTAPNPAPLLGCLESSSSKTMTPEKYSVCKKDDRNMTVSSCSSSEFSLVSRPASPLSIAENLVPKKPQKKNATNNKNPGGYAPVISLAVGSSNLESSSSIKINGYVPALTPHNSEKRPKSQNRVWFNAFGPSSSLFRPVSPARSVESSAPNANRPEKDHACDYTKVGYVLMIGKPKANTPKKDLTNSEEENGYVMPNPSPTHESSPSVSEAEVENLTPTINKTENLNENASSGNFKRNLSPESDTSQVDHANSSEEIICTPKEYIEVLDPQDTEECNVMSLPQPDPTLTCEELADPKSNSSEKDLRNVEEHKSAACFDFKILRWRFNRLCQSLKKKLSLKRKQRNESLGPVV